MKHEDYTELKAQVDRIEGKLDVVVLLQKQIDRIDGRIWGLVVLAVSALGSALLAIVRS